ncbi:MAG TPA: NADH-ubiquinone oxidoreductase-F iron-sulfur binding region domain-containing protein [Actinomycetota bacterium]|nr:NADH-ubiquinone oxidoreductase-F iron-sulfur binding region domain-containing protein [Actinomycetota bacterium]
MADAPQATATAAPHLGEPYPEQVTPYVICNRVLPERPIESLDEYISLGGGDALEIALAVPQAEIIDMVRRSGLRGRGGAGFPTGVKWGSMRADPATTKYLCCNGAEGEPATWKDRLLMARNPYQIFEGVAIGAYATGASAAFVALKRRFHPQVKAMERALKEMKEADMLGSVPIELRLGPDEYLFGEERGLLEVIENRDPMPRILPTYMQGILADPEHPYPALVNNVETFSNIPGILRNGPEWFRSLGTDRSPGTMIFTMVGDLVRPGVYELPLGISTHDLLYDVCGGPLPGREFKALVPGVSNPVLVPSFFDTPMDYDSIAAVGSGLGSGSWMVYDDTACMMKAAVLFSNFLHVESCGQCVPCKTQSLLITERLRALEAGTGTQGLVREALAACNRVTDGNRCYVPQAESVVVQSILRIFVGEVEAHIEYGGCPFTRELQIPKLVDFNEATGEFTFDDHYSHKRSDWTYDDQPIIP